MPSVTIIIPLTIAQNLVVVVRQDFLQVGDRGFVQFLGLDRLFRDLAQGNDRVLVAIAIEGQLRAARNLARPLGSQQDEIETVGDLVYAVFDSNARHWHSDANQVIPGKRAT